MKLLIASDIHGSTLYCKALLEACGRENPDRMLLLGDLLYHGPRNGLPVEYEPREVISMLNGLKDHLLCVRGNCDTEVDQMCLEFPIMAEYCVLYPLEGGPMVLATHGHHFHKAALPPLAAGDILLHGHTHVPACEKVPLGKDPDQDYVWYLNPGSVSLPKGGSRHSYMTLETEPGILRFAWKDLEGDIYHTLEI